MECNRAASWGGKGGCMLGLKQQEDGVDQRQGEVKGAEAEGEEEERGLQVIYMHV